MDPYYFNSNIWVVLSFPKSNYSPAGYLFLLINASTGESHGLKVGPDDPYKFNENHSSFAIASVEDKDNMEIIGVDLVGNIHVWDLAALTFKFSATMSK